MVQIDLHIHSKFSKRPSQWILQKIGCPESFIEPTQVYRIARERGMDLVTLTDHNTIEGALEIAHLPDTFISEEITSYFPEDHCKIHVLAYDITEAQHQEIQAIRRNVYELVAYLNRENIPHGLAHPLYAVNDRLSLTHIEQMLLLFRTFELNGARSDVQNQSLAFILSQITPAHIDALSDKYGYQPLFDQPWIKFLTGGSDDHSGLNIARTHTRIEGATTVRDAVTAIGSACCQVRGRAATPLTMAHNLYGIAYQFYRSRFNLDRHIHKDRLLTFLDRSLMPEVQDRSHFMSRVYYFLNHRKQRRSEESMSDSLMDLIRRETDRLLRKDPKLLALDPSGEKALDRERTFFHFVNTLTNAVLSISADHLLGHLSGIHVFNIFQTLGSAGGLYTLLAPYFIAYSHFKKDQHLTDAVFKRFVRPEYLEIQEARSLRVAHFTDTFYDVNGVAKTLQQQVRIALKNRKHLTVITCDPESRPADAGIRNFAPIGIYEIPEYPDQKIYYPPILEMLNFCHEEGFTRIHSATPGPIGLAALAVAHILKLPITSTYHTAFPQYAQHLTGDTWIEELTWKYMLWYYDQMDLIYVSSQSSADELINKGINPEKIKRFPRGIDTEHFHPRKRNGYLAKRYGVAEPVRLLYVGRVSREKNLPLLVQAFTEIAQVRSQVHLMVVGDGPYLKDMQQALSGMPVTFTGYLRGEELAQVYAGSDLFVFPSTTDTFGNVVLEAQASGLPVIVTDQGGPCENMVPDQTGLVIAGNDVNSLIHAVQTLILNAEQRKAMGEKARAYVEDRSFENAFIETWKMYEDLPRPMPFFPAQAV